MEGIFTSYKGRSVRPGQRVQVYRNLAFKNKPVYSIRDAKSKLVLGHATQVLLTSCSLVVSRAGRERVIREQCKNVCAWIEGFLGVIHVELGDLFADKDAIKVRFNPYKDETFVYNGGFSIYTANAVFINEYGVFAFVL